MLEIIECVGACKVRARAAAAGWCREMIEYQYQCCTPGLRLAVALDGVQAPLLGSLAALLKILLVVVLCWPEPGHGNIVL